MSPTDVSSNSSYNKSQLKKLVKDHSAKDIKRQIDAMFKRVEKHFAEGDDNTGNTVAVCPERCSMSFGRRVKTRW